MTNTNKDLKSKKKDIVRCSIVVCIQVLFIGGWISIIHGTYGIISACLYSALIGMSLSRLADYIDDYKKLKRQQLLDELLSDEK